MADASDVETALVALIVGIVYPNGTSSASVANTEISVERGWPTEADIRNASSANIQLIRVHAMAGMSRDAERYFRSWQQGTTTAPTLAAAVSGALVTLSGTITAGNILAILVGQKAYTYVVQASSTLATIATGMAAKITDASSSGSVITLPGQPAFAAVYASTDAAMELGRQKQMFSVSVWATTPTLRDTIFSAVMPALALPYRMTMPDGSTATRDDLMSGGPNDLPSRAKTWARDIRMSWEFGLVISEIEPPAAAIGVTSSPNVTGAPGTTTYTI
jgi:hypothetical protein